MNAIYINFMGRPQECIARKYGDEMFMVLVNGEELFTHISNLIIF